MSTLAPITLSESKRLTELESVIKRGLDNVWKVADALVEIRNRNLYRADFKSFEAYCDATFNISRQHAYKLIEAAEVKSALPEKCQARLTSARAAEALAEVPESARAAVVEKAAESGKVTAKSIKAAAEKSLPSEPAPFATGDFKGGPLPFVVTETQEFIYSKAQRLSELDQKLYIAAIRRIAGMLEAAMAKNKENAA